MCLRMPTTDSYSNSDNAGRLTLKCAKSPSTEYRAAGMRSGIVVQDKEALYLIEPSDPEGLWKAAPNEP